MFSGVKMLLLEDLVEITNSIEQEFSDISENENNLTDYVNDIFYFESNKRVLIVHTKSDEYSFYGKLDQVEKELDGKDFIRTHQSYFVNARKIKSVSKDSAELLNGEILPVRKSKASAVKNAYLWAKR